MRIRQTWQRGAAVRHFVLAFWVFSFAAVAVADDWPQWMGPQRDGTWAEAGVVETLPRENVAAKWKVPIFGGYSGPAVVGDRVFITDYAIGEGAISNDPGGRNQLSGKERVLCLNAATGEELWKYEYDCKYAVSYADGPRCTPTVDGDRVYCLGSEGNLICLNTGNGDLIWKEDLKTTYKTETQIWGFCGHPLVDGDKLIVLAGGAGSVAVAFDKATGKELWKAVTASAAGYCPPSIIEAAGKRQLIIWDADKINSLDPETGKEYWTEELKPAYDMSIMMPRKSGDYLFAGGIGEVSALLQLEKKSPGAKVVWRGNVRNSIFPANATPIVDEGIMYGADCKGGELRAVRFETGERLWQSYAATTGNRRGGHGTAFLVKNTYNGLYYIFSETGDLVLAKLTPKAYTEIARMNLVKPTQECFGRDVIWSHPAFAQKCVFARNSKELVCYSLAQ